MLHINIYPIRKEKESRLRAWLSELNNRADEVRQTFADESVRAEQAYIVSTSDGPLLIYAIEAENFEQGAKAYASSTHPIDAQHKEIKLECLEARLDQLPDYSVAMP
ncbi:MAG: hypothetical protein GKR90_17690 [Pseudomonadales bacterium]|nr:hypothetical protein [Pseudomonadales bacterium]